MVGRRQAPNGKNRTKRRRKGRRTLSTITFIGTNKATEDETDALDYLGRILAHQSVELVTTAKGEANNAVLKGYKDYGSVPTVLETGVMDHAADQLIVYADEELQEVLDKTFKDWRKKKHHILLGSKQQLFDFLDLLLGEILKRTGQTVQPY